jgi:hypothetical protein
MGSGWQPPVTHVAPASQAMLHIPQCAALELVSTHAPPQSVRPPPHAQLPPSQKRLDPQAMLHIPQCESFD